MKKNIISCLFIVVFVGLNMFMLHAQEPPSAPLSSKTRVCLGCHTRFTPAIVDAWHKSRHAVITPEKALQKPDLEKRISAADVPENLSQYAVGCYECHGLNIEQHDDSFAHMGTDINIVVSPNDCQTCHPEEVTQYSASKKAYAHPNLMDNPVYTILVNTLTGVKTVDESGELRSQAPSQMTLNDVCLGCHGTRVEVQGMKKYTTAMGKISVPDLKNWPNQGVGRINPDGSRGSCTSCHTRHRFSIAEARKPYTCSQCHGDPDVPAYQVYKVSKHGNIFAAHQQEWDFEAVPWQIGRDFSAPSCAACHNSLLTRFRSDEDVEVVAERTHDFGARLYKRIFGLIYSHPQPKSGDTTVIKNADGLPLATTFHGTPAHEYLIDETEQQRRLNVMKAPCISCHGTSWTDKHFERFEHTVNETDQMVLAATGLMINAWEHGIADNQNPFDEALEQIWIKEWLFYANTVRYASAMTGGYKYTAFHHGWWDLTNNLQEMKDRILSLLRSQEQKYEKQ